MCSFSKIIENSRGHISMHTRSLGLTFNKKPSSQLEDAFESASCRSLSETLQSFEWWDQIPAVIKSLFSPSLSSFLIGPHAVCIYRLPAVHRIGWCGLNSASWTCKENFSLLKGTTSGTRLGFAHAKLRLLLALSWIAQLAVNSGSVRQAKRREFASRTEQAGEPFSPEVVAVFLIQPLHNVLAKSSPGLCEVGVQNRRVKIISLQGLLFH